MLARMEQYMPVKPARAGADGSDEEADDGLCGVRRGAVGGVVADEDDDREDGCDDADGLVLALEEGFGAFADGVRNELHLGGAGVGGDDGAGEEESEDEGDQCDGDGNPEIDAGHHWCR